MWGEGRVGSPFLGRKKEGKVEGEGGVLGGEERGSTLGCKVNKLKKKKKKTLSRHLEDQNALRYSSSKDCSL